MRTDLPAEATPAVLPDIGDLARQVRFSPANGRIWIRDHRGVPLNGSAFAALRRGMINRIAYLLKVEEL